MNTLLIKKIISGGQTGADMGGLLAGKILEIPTGGYAPRGWKTENGSQEGFLKFFNLKEWQPPGYAARTLANVILCNATIIIGDINSSGSLLTKKYCLNNKKPLYHQPFPSYKVSWSREDGANYLCHLFRQWLALQHIGILNVAGNRESKNPGIEAFTRSFLVEVLQEKPSCNP